ncbi:MAG: hypothetical protein WCG92_25665, partial [Hyphomicrobiales bacterium]
MADAPADAHREAPGDAPLRFQFVLKLAVLPLIVALIGLPINHMFDFALLVLSVIVLAVGRMTSQWRRWATAALVVAAALGGKLAIDVPRIEEGHNVFLPGGTDNALVTGLPPDVYRAMANEFDLSYPVSNRCDAKTPGCWQGSDRPKRVYAFSFDGI